jgi:hypothetical protein
MNVGDHGFVAALECRPRRAVAVPREPAVLVLIEHEQRLVA